jgi:predicted transcriptional regulator
MNDNEKKAEIFADSWEDPPIRKIGASLRYLGFKPKEEEVRGLFLDLQNDERSNWIYNWTPPTKELEIKEKENIEQRARKLLKDPLLLQKIRTVLDFKIAGLGKKKLGVFLALLTKNLKDPKERTSVCIYGKWGEGKSYLIEKVLELFDCERMNSATLAGIYRDSLKDRRYYDGKILYFGDIGDSIPDDLEQVFNFFKQLITEGKAVKKLVMDQGGDLETKDLVLEGFPILVWTAQTTPDDEQILSRVLPMEPDFSEEQRRLIQEHSSFENELPEEMIYPKEYRELERIVKTALKILEKESLPVINPFARLINSCMSIHSPNINRDRQKFFGIVHALTHLHQYQRAKIKVHGKEYVVVSPLDVVNALYLVGEEFKALFGALDKISQKAYRVIQEKVDPITKPLKELEEDASNFENPDLKIEATIELRTKGFTNEDLADWMNIHPKTAWKITTKLKRKGLLDRKKEGKAYKYYLLPEYTERSKTNGFVLFDSRRMIEGLISEKELREWLNRYNFSISLEEGMEKIYFINQDDLESTPTPEARVFEFSLIPFWDHLEMKLMEPPFSFKSWLKESFLLGERKRTKEESSEKPDEESSNQGEKEDNSELGKKEEEETVLDLTSEGDSELLEVDKPYKCYCGENFDSREEFDKHASFCERFQAVQAREAKYGIDSPWRREDED